MIRDGDCLVVDGVAGRNQLIFWLEPHHTPAFWTRVERAVPNFARRKQWLAENAMQAVAV